MALPNIHVDDLDIILPGFSFTIQPKGLRYQQKGKLRVVIHSIDPSPTEKNAVYFDPVVTQVSALAEIEPRQAKKHPTAAWRMNRSGIGGLSPQIDIIDRKLSFLINAVPLITNWHNLGPTTFLLHGVEGTGKTLLLDRLAECPWQEVHRINVHTHPKNQAKGLSETFQDALASQPSLILMDELDRFLEKAETLVTVLRAELAKLIGSQVVVAASARSVYDVEASLRTTSAFKIELELLPPNVKQRQDILRQRIGTSRGAADVDYQSLTERSHGFVGRDLAQLCSLAQERRVDTLYASLDDDQIIGVDKILDQSALVTQEDFDAVFDQVKPTVLKDSILEVPKVRWSEIAGLDHVRASIESIITRPFKVRRPQYTGLHSS